MTVRPVDHASNLEERVQLQIERPRKQLEGWSPDVMKDELAHALREALYELRMLPHHNPDAALIGLYAVMDDLRSALDRTEALDLPRRSH
jgi:hypothetical protein